MQRPYLRPTPSFLERSTDMEKPQKKLLDALILVKAAWVSAYRGIAKPILKGANYQFLADTDGEIKIHE